SSIDLHLRGPQLVNPRAAIRPEYVKQAIARCYQPAVITSCRPSLPSPAFRGFSGHEPAVEARTSGRKVCPPSNEAPKYMSQPFLVGSTRSYQVTATTPSLLTATVGVFRIVSFCA